MCSRYGHWRLLLLTHLLFSFKTKWIVLVCKSILCKSFQLQICLEQELKALMKLRRKFKVNFSLKPVNDNDQAKQNRGSIKSWFKVLKLNLFDLIKLTFYSVRLDQILFITLGKYFFACTYIISILFYFKLTKKMSTM